MTVRHAFTDLVDGLDALAQALKDAQWAAVQPQANDEGHALVDRIDTLLTDAISAVEEAGNAAREGLRHQADLPRAHRLLISAHRHYQQAADLVHNELTAYDQIDALRELAAERAEWAGWAEGVREALLHCAGPLYDVGQALFGCWQDLSERALSTSVSVQATNIGQHIQIVRAPASAGAEGPTEAAFFRQD